eukprot:10267241-Alexandrium_andersonii.AAC.1
MSLKVLWLKRGSKARAAAERRNRKWLLSNRRDDEEVAHTHSVRGILNCPCPLERLPLMCEFLVLVRREVPTLRLPNE